MKQWTFSVTARGNTLAEARVNLQVDKRIDTTIPMSAKEDGFVHEDGVVRPCGIPEKDFCDEVVPFREFLERVYEQAIDEFKFLEVPKGCSYSETQGKIGTSPPVGTKIWRNGEWRPFYD